MLPEPEHSIVEAFLNSGGQILRVPFGISGKVFGMRELSVAYGMRGWIQRFGIRHVPNDCIPFILAGELSVPAARAELVWDLIEAHGGRATVTGLSKALGLTRPPVQNILEILERAGAVRRIETEFPARYVIFGPPPRWPEFLKPTRQAA